MNGILFGKDILVPVCVKFTEIFRVQQCQLGETYPLRRVISDTKSAL